MGNANTTASELYAKIKALKAEDSASPLLTFGEVVLEAGTTTLGEHGIKSGSIVQLAAVPPTWVGVYACSIYADYSDFDHPVYISFDMDVGVDTVKVGDVTGNVVVNDDA